MNLNKAKRTEAGKLITGAEGADETKKNAGKKSGKKKVKREI